MHPSIWSARQRPQYSHSMTILLTFIPDTKLKDIEKVEIRLVVCWCGGLLAGISPMQEFIKYIHDALTWNGESHKPTIHTYIMLKVNYSRHMAFVTDLPFAWSTWQNTLAKTMQVP